MNFDGVHKDDGGENEEDCDEAAPDDVDDGAYPWIGSIIEDNHKIIAKWKDLLCLHIII